MIPGFWSITFFIAIINNKFNHSFILFPLGTKLEKRLAKGQKSIKYLDLACREHDIAYPQNKCVENRHKNKERVKCRDAKLGEKAPAWFVTMAM